MKETRLPVSIKTLLPMLLFVFLLSACGRGPIQATSWPGVTLLDDTLYIAYNQFVRAINLETEREIWRYPAEADRNINFYAPPAISDDGIVILGGYDQNVYALSTASGRPEPIWIFDEASDRIIGGPAISGETVLIPSADHRLYAVNLNNGRPVWEQPFESGHALWSAPLIDGETVYLASLDHSIYALDLESGDLIWEISLGSAISDTPTLSNGLLLCGTFEGLLFALDKETGKEVWKFEAGAAIWGNPVVDDEVIYVADVDRDAFALDLEDGSLLWRTTLASSASTSPITDESTVFFVSEEGSVEAFDKTTGDPVWPTTNPLVGRLLADPILVEDELLVPVMDNSDCIIFGVAAGTGSTRCVVPQDQN